MDDLPCHICHKLIKRHEYTRHVASCLVDTHFWSDPAFTSSFDSSHSNSVFPVQSVPPRSTAHSPQGHGSPLVTPYDQIQSRDPQPSPAASRHQKTPSQTQLNAFQMWLKNYAGDTPKYTTIDGGKSDPNTAFFQAALDLRAITKEEIVKIVKEFKGFPCDDDKKACLELVRVVPIFPGLVAYTYTHLITCPSRGWRRWISVDDWSDRLSELKRLVERWAEYGDLWCFLSCSPLKEALLKILRATQVKSGEHKCNSALLNGTIILKHDILNLAALAALCITERKQYILGGTGSPPGRLVDLLHDLLESGVELEECYRRCFLNVLIPLSKGTGCCPRGFYITEGTISDLEQKGGGAFGTVYVGKLDSRSVAVKVLKQSGSTAFDYDKCLSGEAIVWWYLRHPNCLPLYGAYGMPGGQVALVSPWMDKGTLSDHLKRNPSANRTKLILDVVRGLHYLHTMEPHVAHRDIKPANILITRKGHACLADFGLASVFDTWDDYHTRASHVHMGGTPIYMAPELFNKGSKEERRQVNKRACDMYALGCTIFEIYTGKPPFNSLSDIYAKVAMGRCLEFPVDKVPPDMQSFVENLLDLEPRRRLTAGMALDWMEVKAFQEGLDSCLEPVYEEGEWKGQSDNLWSISS